MKVQHPPTTLQGENLSEESRALLRQNDADTATDPELVDARRLGAARRLLFVSHFFAQFSEAVWQFSLVLFLAAFTNYQSLLLISTYGLTSGLAICLWGTTAGRFVDQSNRLFVAQCFIWMENLGVLIATGLCYWLLERNLLHPAWQRPDLEDPYVAITNAKEGEGQHSDESYSHGMNLDTISILILIGIHFFGAMASLLDKGFVVAIERDWVVVMSQVAHQPKEWLSRVNVVMKQIDLTCKVVSPSIAGFIIAAFEWTPHTTTSVMTATISSNQQQPRRMDSSTDLTGAVLFVGIVNVASLVAEYYCTLRIYHLIPELAHQQQGPDQPPILETEKNGKNCSWGSSTESNDDNKKRSHVGATTDHGCGILRAPPSLKVYWKQSVSSAGFALALLYLNALTFGGLMTAYLVFRGMRLETVGVWRGVSSAIGLAGTFVYHYAVNRTSLVSTGMGSIIYQFVCISCSFASLFIEDYMISISMLIAGVCLSRIGLWVFDIAVTQLMQEFIPDGYRGIVGGTQQSLNAFFQLLSFAIGIIFPNPREFHVCVSAGYLAVAVAMLFYLFGIFRYKDKFLTPEERRSNDIVP